MCYSNYNLLSIISAKKSKLNKWTAKLNILQSKKKIPNPIFYFIFGVNRTNQKIGKKLTFTSALPEINLAKLLFGGNSSKLNNEEKKPNTFTLAQSEIPSATYEELFSKTR